MPHRSFFLSRLAGVACAVLCTSAASWAAPGNVSGVTAVATSPYAVTVTWSKYTGTDFGKYEVRRGTAANLTRSATLVASITDTATTTARDSDLVSYTTYYYRVFVVSATDTASSGVEVSVRTKALNFPHTDAVGATNINFTPSGTWAVIANGPGDGDAATGTNHWTDSPGGNYASNANTALTMTANLGTAIMPVLTYWERYAFETNVDYGYVEVSGDGTNWNQIGFVTGSQTVWGKKQVDLTQWAGAGEVRIRFRIQANASVESEGWHLDDFSIAELAPKSLPYPFVDAFDSTTNWVTSGWSLVTGSHTLPNAIHDSKPGNYPASTRNALVSAGVFNLSGAVNPVLTFWHK